jgi:hypothetical protein
MLKEVNVGFFDKLKLWPETWTANTPYTIGDIVKPTSYASHCYKCTTAGTSHATDEPTWGTTNGGTTTDSGTLVWTCFDTKTYQVVASQGSTVPYVVFGLETETPIGTFDDFEAIESITYWVNAFSEKSAADVAEIADEVMNALDGVTLSVTGYTSMQCRREFIGSVICNIDNGATIFQIPLRYRVYLDKS